MAKLKNNKPLKGLRGKVGELVFRLMPDGSTVISRAPVRRKKKGTPAQTKYRNGTFKDRTQWAKMAQHEHPVYAQLASDRPMITAYNLAISDAAHPPVIYRILVHATDEVMVAGVKVTIHDAQGRLLEAGDAIQKEKDWWGVYSQARRQDLRFRLGSPGQPGLHGDGINHGKI
jgi:hypothetical protein